MGGVTRSKWVNLLAALGLVAGLAFLGVGLPVVDRAFPADRPVRAGEPYLIGAGVTVVPPPGAVLDVTGTRPGDDAGSVLFRIGPVRYAIVVQPFDGDLYSAALRLRQRITGNSGYQVTGSQSAVGTSGGLSGLQGGYTAPGRGGRYTVFVAAGLAIEVTVAGADLDLGRTLPAVEISTGTLAYADEQR